MSVKQLSLIVISAIFLSLGGVLVLREVSAQQRCGGASDPACPAGLTCLSSRCNVPPPVWNNSAGGLPAGQDAGFDVLRASRVRGNLTVGTGFMFPAGAAAGSFITGGDLYANALFSRVVSAGGDDLWLGDGNDRVRAQGALSVGEPVVGLTRGEFRAGSGAVSGGFSVGENLTVTGTINGVNMAEVLTNVTTSATSGLVVEGTGRTRTVRLITEGCDAGEVLKRTAGGVWGCAADAVGGGGPGGAIDHGTLTGLADDDHPQYYRDSGLDGDLAVGGNLSVTGNIVLPGAAATVDGLNLDGVLTNVTAVANGGLAVGGAGRERTVGLTACTLAGQIMKWDPVAGWRCAADEAGAGGGGGGVTGVGVVNKLAFWTGAAALGQNANLHFDPATVRLGIGTAVPTQALEVRDDTGGAARLRIADEAQNPEFQLKYGGGATDHWALYVDQGTQELRLWRGDNRLTLTAGGDLRASGCLGALVVGATVLTYTGNLNGAAAPSDGYRGVDGACNGAFAGSHQCTTAEVLNSVHCGAIWTDATKAALRGTIPAGVFAWISNGAPSLPTPTNDCYGWTQTGVVGGQQSQGIAWNFDVRGGGGYARPCNEANRILCCR